MKLKNLLGLVMFKQKIEIKVGAEIVYQGDNTVWLIADEMDQKYFDYKVSEEGVYTATDGYIEIEIEE